MKNARKEITLSFRVDEKLNQKIEDLATEKRRKKSDIIRLILEDYIKLITERM